MIHGLDWLEKTPRDRGHRVGDVTQDVEAHGLGNGEHLGVLGALQLEPEGTGLCSGSDGFLVLTTARSRIRLLGIVSSSPSLGVSTKPTPILENGRRGRRSRSLVADSGGSLSWTTDHLDDEALLPT